MIAFRRMFELARVEGYLIRAGDFRDHVSALDGAWICFSSRSVNAAFNA